MNKDFIYRVIKTFFQAFIACVLVGIKTVDFSADKAVLKQALITLAISAISAGISALMNINKVLPSAETNAEEVEDEFITEDEKC